MSYIQATLDDLRSRLDAALSAAIAAGELPEVMAPEYVVEAPREPGHGDFAANLAMVLARACGMPPRRIAAALIGHWPAGPTPVKQVEVAGPGFINFHLDPSWLLPVVDRVLREGAAYGQAQPGQRERVLVEFVSANPTGPLNVVNARAAAFGDSLVRIFRCAGYDADREFYVNDAGGQFEKLCLAMITRVRQLLGEPELELPEGAYPGEYLIDIARDYLVEHQLLSSPHRGLPSVMRAGAASADPASAPRPALAPEQVEALGPELGRYAVEHILAGQRQDLARYGVLFERWVRESEIRARGRDGGPEWVVQELMRRGETEEREGAVWFRSDLHGDEKPRVIQRANGAYTYLVPDIAYHVDKFRRGYDRTIDIWGQDHHGYIARMRAALEAMGLDVNRFEVLINQIVRLIRGGEVVRMSKRSGDFVTMAELLDDVGTDAARFFFLMRTIDAHMDFDLDLAALQTNENPVYYVQYAHARIASIIRQAQEQQVPLPQAGQADLRLLGDPSELTLIRRLADLPDEVELAATERAPHRLTVYARDVATLFHSFYAHCRVLGETEELTAARLALCLAAKQVLANTFALLGVSAPEHM